MRAPQTVADRPVGQGPRAVGRLAVTQLAVTRLAMTIVVSTALGALAACAPPPDATADALAGTVAAPVAPATVVVADFRAGPLAAASADGTLSAKQDRLDALFGQPVPVDARVVAERTGAFTSAGDVQQFALVTRGAGMAGASARPSMLAVFEGEQLVAQFVDPDMPYNSVAAVFDADGDGHDEVVLVAQAYQMGQVSMRGDVVSLKGGKRRVLMTLGTVYEDRCDAPLGEPAVYAVVVERNAREALVRRELRAACTSDGTPPPAASFAEVAQSPLLPER